MSWGIFQAAACGARLLVNNFPGVGDVLQKGTYFQVHNLDDQDAVTKAVIDGLASRDHYDPVRSKLKKGLDLQSSLNKWFIYCLSIVNLGYSNILLI